MSDTYEAPEAEEAEDLTETEAEEAEEEEGEGEDEAQASQPKRDWQKIATDAKGQAAAERAKRREIQRDRDEMARRIEALEAKAIGKGDPLSDLAAALRDDDEDPIGDINSVKALAKQLIREREEEARQAAESANQRRYISALNEAMNESEADFRADNPDYDEAVKHFREAMLDDLSDQYGGQQLQAKFAEALYEMVGNAIKAGKDPAEVVYRRAKRYGFKSSAVDEASKKLQTLAKASRAGVTPNGVGKGNLSASSVANLKGADFDKAFAALRAQQRH